MQNSLCAGFEQHASALFPADNANRKELFGWSGANEDAQQQERVPCVLGSSSMPSPFSLQTKQNAENCLDGVGRMRMRSSREAQCRECELNLSSMPLPSLQTMKNAKNCLDEVGQMRMSSSRKV